MVEIPMICRYCGGAVHLVPAAKVYGPAAAKRLGLEREKFYQCQNCNARVGCHKGSTRPLGNLANEALRMKRMETHQIFDSFWKERGMSRTQGYKLGKKEWKGGSMPFAQLMAVLPLRDVACSLRVPSNSNDLKCNKDENETVIAHRSDCGLFLSPNRKE